jgi:hypothetical protein
VRQRTRLTFWLRFVAFERPVPTLLFPGLQTQAIIRTMDSAKYIYWQDQGQWIGYLQDYPGYWTQGESFEDLQFHLRDLYRDLPKGQRPISCTVEKVIYEQGRSN